MLRRADSVTAESCGPALLLALLMFILAAAGLGSSLFPFVVRDQLTVWQAASSRAALMVNPIGVCIRVPAILARTVLACRVFHRKARELTCG